MRLIGLAVILSLILVPLAAEGQEAGKVSRIGLLGYSAGWEPFRQALRDLGYAEGRNIAIEHRLTEGRQERLHEHAAELVRLKVDVLVTAGTPPTQAAMRATTTIPIVMVSTGDPLRTALVASLAHPGGNVTGNTILGAELAGKRLQLSRTSCPTSLAWPSCGTRQMHPR